MEKRKGYFDVAKGIAILCIIFGHMGIVRVNSLVFTFHVPIFFFISGYFLNEKRPIKEYFVEKAKQLLIPYYVTCICIILGIGIRDIVMGAKFTSIWGSIRIWILAGLYGSGGIIEHQPTFVIGIGAIWFLPALLFSLIIVRYLIQFQFGGIGIVAIAYIGYKMTDFIWLPMSIQSGMFASIFVYLGWLARKKKLMENKVPDGILAILTGIWLLCILYGGEFYIVQNYLKNGLLDIIGAVAASYLVILFSKFLSEHVGYIANILRYYGTNTLIMLCVHTFELKVLSWQWVWNIPILQQQSQTMIYCVIFFLKIFFCTISLFVVNYIKDACQTLHLFRIKKDAIECICPISNATIERVQYWDIAKGIGIIVCVLGHSPEIPSILRMMIFSFHMPLFFIANGYFVKRYEVKQTFLKSIKTLICPYVITCLLSATIYTLITQNGESAVELFLSKILVMFGGMSKISTRFSSWGSVWLVWFVCCLFVTRNIYVIVMSLMKKCKESLKIAVIFILALAGYLIGKYYAFMPWSLDVALVSLMFFYFGDWLRRAEIFDKVGLFGTLVVPGTVWIYCLQMGIHIELATRKYPFGILSILEAIAGSMVVISCSKLLQNVNILSGLLVWCGKNSMIILILHCLEMMYFNWNAWIFDKLPFSVNWFRAFVIKMTFILILTCVYDIFKTRLKNGFRCVMKD